MKNKRFVLTFPHTYVRGAVESIRVELNTDDLAYVRGLVPLFGYTHNNCKYYYLYGSENRRGRAGKERSFIYVPIRVWEYLDKLQ